MARRKVPRRGFGRGKQEGGLLVGPSHEQGGIGAVISGGEQVELEGGEYIINAQTVDALGVPFLDKINSTQTSYHTGGYGAGELPGPSMYRRGGTIRRNNMRRRRKFHRGGRMHRHPHAIPSPGGPDYHWTDPGLMSGWGGGENQWCQPWPECKGTTYPADPSVMSVDCNRQPHHWQCNGKEDPWMDQVRGGKGSRRLRNFKSHGGVKRRGGRIYAGGGNIPYDADYNGQFSSGLNPYRRGGRVFGGGGAAYGNPNSCIDGRTGRNVPCM